MHSTPHRSRRHCRNSFQSIFIRGAIKLREKEEQEEEEKLNGHLAGKQLRMVVMHGFLHPVFFLCCAHLILCVGLKNGQKKVASSYLCGAQGT